MNLPHRLEAALQKLYTAYHSGQLDPEDCRHCAVGNICDNFDAWKHFTDAHGSLKLNYLGRLNESLGKRINGYSPQELLSVEAVFLKGCGYYRDTRQNLKKPAKIIDREMMFRGMFDVVAFLCALDGVENIMEQYKRFDLAIDQKNQPAEA